MQERPSDRARIGASPPPDSAPNTALILQSPAPSYAVTMLPPDSRRLFAQLLRILYKRRWRLFHFVATALLLTIVLQFLFPRLYSSTAVLRLDRHSAPGVMGQEASQIASINDMEEIITTDIELGQSDPVVRPVAEKYHLIDYEKQAAGWRRFFGGKADQAAIEQQKAAPILLSGLKLMRPAGTYLINVTYRAWKDPQLAANVANGIAQSLASQLKESTNQSYEDLSGAMQRDMQELHSKMDLSAERLAQYEKDLKIVDPEQHSSVLTARLTQLLTEYTGAQVDRLHKQAMYEAVTKSPTLAETQATESGNPKQSALDSALERLAVAQQQFAAARSYYGENHPEFRKAQQQLEEAQRQVDGLRVAGDDKAAAEYRQSLDRELLIKRQLDHTRAEVDGLKSTAIEYTQLKTEAENDRRLYMDLEGRVRDADVNRQFRDTTVQLASRALPAAEPIFPKLLINLPLVFFVALALGVLGAIAADAFDPTFADADEVSARLRLSPMAALPEARHLIAPVENLVDGVVTPGANRFSESNMPYEEAVRMLRNSIGLASADRPLGTVLITSAIPGEGKTTTAANLAVACAQGGKKVLLIDADLRQPALHHKFDIGRDAGLSDVLTNRLLPVDVIVEVDVPGLFVMPAGPTLLNASDLISLGFATTLNQVSRNFDLVIVDAPPLLGVSETQELAGMVDGVLVVAKADSTPASALAETLAMLGRSRAQLLGVVMNQVKVANVRGFGYYRQKQKKDAPEAAA